MATPYVDYPYYTTTYLGVVISEDDFDRIALRASADIDQMTYRRAEDETDVDVIDKIKMATCAVAEEIQYYINDGSVSGIKSEKTGQHSITYADKSTKMQPLVDKKNEAAALYLGGTGLLYQGFKSGELGGVPNAD